MKKALLNMLILFFLASPSLGAIAVEDTSIGATSGVLSHDVSGSDTILIVGIGHEYIGETYITGVTYNGTAMTRLEGLTSYTRTYDLNVWYLLNPDAGTHDIAASSTSTQINIMAVTLSGAEQEAPDSNQDVTNGVGSIETDITTTTADEILLAFGYNSTTTAWQAVAGQTLLMNQNAPGGNSHDEACYSKAVASAAATSATVETNETDNMINTVVAIAEVQTPSGAPPQIW